MMAQQLGSPAQADISYDGVTRPWRSVPALGVRGSVPVAVCVGAARFLTAIIWTDHIRLHVHLVAD